MNRRLIFTIFFFMFFAAGIGLYASGNKDAEISEPLNKDWTLCITAFDTSAMSPSWQTAGDTVTRNLVTYLQNLDFRLRDEDETVYYRSYALEKSRVTAADALVKKRNERDLLVFKGDPSWKYEKALKTVDEAIVLLEEELEKSNAVIPIIEAKPAFKLSEKNTGGTFPLPPETGKENFFCTEQKADAFLAGTLSEYYGRVLLDIKLYTRYTGAYSYEDSVLFSPDDFNGALNEISNRLAAEVSGNQISGLLVHAEPPETMILLDGAFAGQGETARHIRSAGTAEIAVRADNHVPAVIPLELNPGEIAELFVNLTPLGFDAFRADVPGSPGSKVFLGGLFVGETPLALELPKTGFSYVSVETPEGEVGSAIYKDNSIVKGSAQFVWNDNSGGQADFSTMFPVSKEAQVVANARNSFYKYYGALWFILPAALLTAGIANSYIDANDYISSNPGGLDQGARDRMGNSASQGTFVRAGAYGLMGAALGATFFQIYRYLKASGGDSTPIARVPSEG